MSNRDAERDEPMVIASASELMFAGTRRSFLGKLFAGGTVLLLPSVFTGCDDDDGDGNNPLGPGVPDPVTGVSFDLRTDVGIFQLVHTLEHLEAAFYTAVVSSPVFQSFSPAEQEVLVDIRDAEVIHREFLTAALGAQAIPDIRGSINQTRLNQILELRGNVLAVAKTFENLGVAGLNGAGKYLQDPRNLLLAGKFASVEARHAAALLDMAPPAGQNANTAFAGDFIIDANGRDVKLEAGAVIARVASTGILAAGTLAAAPISNGPTPAQGVPTDDLFPAIL
jgi:hypothetical protein